MIVTNLSTIKETFPKIWQYVHTALTAYEKNPAASGRQEIDGEMVFFTLSEDPLQPQEERTPQAYLMEILQKTPWNRTILHLQPWMSRVSTQTLKKTMQ